jgi:hypothetical protein
MAHLYYATSAKPSVVTHAVAGAFTAAVTIGGLPCTVLSESHEDIMSRPVAEEDLAASFASLRAMLAQD